MACGVKQGGEAFCLPNCLHEQMVLSVLTVPVLAWLVRLATTTTANEASCLSSIFVKNTLCIDQESV